MAFKNKIRLPFYISKPQFQVDSDVYRQTNGRRRVTKAVISKELIGRTDWMPALIHERFIVALQHDTVTITGEKFQGNIRINGGYEIAWPENDFPVAPGNFKAFDEGFSASNSSCATCDEITRMDLVDDRFPAALPEGGTYQINVAVNDAICCVGPVFSILSFDASYVESAEIDQNGLLTITLKAELPSVGETQLVRYQVACGESLMDAGVMAEINGSLSESCAPPINLTMAFVEDPMPFAAAFDWDHGGGAPAGGYNWNLERLVNLAPSVPVSNGNTPDTHLLINALDELKKYRLYVRAVCSETEISAPTIISFTVPPAGDGRPDPHITVFIVVELYEVSQVGEDYQIGVRATVTGTTFQELINVSGNVNLFGSGFQNVNFNINIAPNTGVGETGAIALVNAPLPGWSGDIQSAVVLPETAHETTTNILFNLATSY